MMKKMGKSPSTIDMVIFENTSVLEQIDSCNKTKNYDSGLVFSETSLTLNVAIYEDL